MKDITRVFEQWSEAQGFQYEYGQNANLNLLNSLEENKVYFLHNENRRRPRTSQTTGFGTGYSFSGNFFLVVQSDLDMPYYKEMQQDNCENKYEKNIEPLLKFIDDFVNFFACSEYTINSLEVIDITDLLDFNADGLVVTYAISI